MMSPLRSSLFAGTPGSTESTTQPVSMIPTADFIGDSLRLIGSGYSENSRVLASTSRENCDLVVLSRSCAHDGTTVSASLRQSLPRECTHLRFCQQPAFQDHQLPAHTMRFSDLNGAWCMGKLPGRAQNLAQGPGQTAPQCRAWPPVFFGRRFRRQA